LKPAGNTGEGSLIKYICKLRLYAPHTGAAIVSRAKGSLFHPHRSKISAAGPCAGFGL